MAASPGRSLVTAEVPGSRLTVRGRLIDGNGEGVSDAMLEIWQADASGCYPDGGSPFRGFGRIHTDASGGFDFTTIKPGHVAGPDGTRQAPHLVLHVFMRGLLKHLTTRLYFSDEPSNREDAVLQLIDADRRPTLIARQVPSSGAVFEWDIILQGPEETVFLEY
jgi:protocatechuate 3,4-dioxygenase alpha subunit